MKKLPVVLLCLSAVLLLSGCNRNLPDIPDAERISQTLPDSLSSVTMGDTVIPVEPTAVTIVSRDTDLEHQTDDVTCTISLSGDGVDVALDCELDYAYVRDSGWTVRDYSFNSDPVLTITDESFLSDLKEEAVAEVVDALGFENVTCTSGTWSEDSSTYYILCSVDTGNRYLTIDGDVQVNDTLSYSGSGLVWSWTSELDQDNIKWQPNMLNTTWHLYNEETVYELAFQVTGIDGNEFTINGLVRYQSSTGHIKEVTIDQAVEWSASEYGRLQFQFYADQNITISISSSELSADNMQGASLGELENVESPASGSLADIMKLDAEESASGSSESIWDRIRDLLPSGSSSSSTPQEPVDQSDKSVSDFLRDIFHIFIS